MTNTILASSGRRPLKPTFTPAQRAAFNSLRPIARRQVSAASPRRTAAPAPSTGVVSVEEFCRRLGLPADASAAQIRAALAKPAPTAAPSRPAAARPIRPKLTAGAVAAMSAADLQSAERDALGADERRLVRDELDHRSSMSLMFPAAARASGYERVRPDFTARSSSGVKGVSEAG